MALTVHLTAFEIVYERTEQHQKVGNLGEKHKYQVFPKFILSISKYLAVVIPPKVGQPKMLFLFG